MAATWNYARQLPPGISHATYANDLEQSLKLEVAERMLDAPWNSYSSISQIASGDRVAKAFRIAVDSARISLHRGAEEALIAIAHLISPRRMFAPKYSYPGYARIANRLQIELRYYEAIGDLSGVESSDLLVVNWPEPILQEFSSEAIIEHASARSCSIAIDATFSLLDGTTPSELLGTSEKYSSFLVLSASKSLGLAAARFGICISPSNRSLLTNDMEWDVFQCALLDTLLEERTIERRARRVADAQRLFQPMIRDLAMKFGLEVLPSSSSFYVAVSDPNASIRRYGDTGWKRFANSDVIRIDANRIMLNRLREGLGGIVTGKLTDGKA